MINIIKLPCGFSENTTFVFKEDYHNFKIYQQKAPSGALVSQDWVITDDGLCHIHIASYNHKSKEELYDDIDRYIKTKKFGYKVFIKEGFYEVHDEGNIEI